MTRKIPTVACMALLAFAAQAPAHHSAVAFDKSRTEVVEGTVTKFIWRNPHLSITMDVNGEPWRVEGGSTNEMFNNGFDRNSLSEGDKISVLVNPLKSGDPGGLMQGLTTADGTTFGMEETSYASGSAPTAPANPLSTERQLPSLTEYVPPPAGDTWQKREARTRPSTRLRLRQRLRIRAPCPQCVQRVPDLAQG